MKALMIAMWVLCGIALVLFFATSNYLAAIWVAITAFWVGNAWIWHNMANR